MNCSKCKTQLPPRRIPTSLGQMLLGGWTCPHCQTALDGQGRVLDGPYNTPAALLLALLFLAGLGLSNYLIFGAGRTGLALLTLVLTLALGGLGARALQPKVRAN